MGKWIVASMIAVWVCGCASTSDEVGSIYVSPLTYQSYNCQQIGQEAERVSRRAAEIAGVQDSKATSDAVMTGVGLVLFWPSLFFIKGDGQSAAELGRLKGEFETLEKVSIEKNCGLQFRKPQSQPQAGS
jgi:hypothetical protein